MVLVAAGNHHNIDLRITQDLLIIGTGIGSPKALAVTLSSRAVVGIHGPQPDPGLSLKVGKVLPLCQIARPHQGYLNLTLFGGALAGDLDLPPDGDTAPGEAPDTAE